MGIFLCISLLNLGRIVVDISLLILYFVVPMQKDNLPDFLRENRHPTPAELGRYFDQVIKEIFYDTKIYGAAYIQCLIKILPPCERATYIELLNSNPLSMISIITFLQCRREKILDFWNSSYQA